MPNELLGQLQDAAAASAAIDALRTARNAARQKASTLLTTVGTRAMTEAEETEFNGYVTEAERLQVSLTAHEKLGNIPTDATTANHNPNSNPGTNGTNGTNGTTGSPTGAVVARAALTGLDIRTYDNQLHEPWGYRFLGDACEPTPPEATNP